jgi:deazaflavin-dependent oxidoreductase (nitroreductase family)
VNTPFNQQIIEEFRANDGKVGGMFEGASLVLLTTTGAKSGKQHTNPLAQVTIDGRMVIVASAAGADKHPAWFHNLSKNPGVQIESGTETFAATAVVPGRAERDRLWPEVVAQGPGYGDYQTKTTRVIPIVFLDRA